MAVSSDVNAISFPSHGSFIYMASADGLVCKIDSMLGNLRHMFKASTKAISSLSISSDIISKQGEDEVTIYLEDHLRSLGYVTPLEKHPKNLSEGFMETPVITLPVKDMLFVAMDKEK